MKDDSNQRKLVHALSHIYAAVEFDREVDLENALEAYTSACGSLQLVVSGVSESDDQRKLDSIYLTLSKRAETLRQLVEKPDGNDDEDDATVYRCICGEKDSLNTRTLIGCAKCGVFQHCICMGVPVTDGAIPENYLCEQCAPDDHRETLQALERGLKIWQSRNYLHEAQSDSESVHPILREYSQTFGKVDSLDKALAQLDQDFADEKRNRIVKRGMGEVLEETDEDLERRYQDFRSRLEKRLQNAETRAETASIAKLSSDANAASVSRNIGVDVALVEDSLFLNTGGMDALSAGISDQEKQPTTAPDLRRGLPQQAMKFAQTSLQNQTGDQANDSECTTILQYMVPLTSLEEKDARLPDGFLLELHKRVTGVLSGREQTSGYKDPSVKRTFAAFLNELQHPASRKVIENNRRIENMLLIFAPKAAEELRRSGLSEGNPLRVILFRHLALFVRIICSVLDTNQWSKLRREVFTRLKTLETVLLQHHREISSGLVQHSPLQPTSEDETAEANAERGVEEHQDRHSIFISPPDDEPTTGISYKSNFTLYGTQDDETLLEFVDCEYPGCTRYFESRANMLGHMRNAHQVNISSSQVEAGLAEELAVRYSLEGNIDRHGAQDTGRALDVVDCEYRGCTRYFESRAKMLAHTREVHAERAVFGIPLAEAVEFARPANVATELPAVVYRCIEYLLAKNAVAEEGIFRFSGSNTVIKALKDRFDSEGDVDLLADGNYRDIHAVASLLKHYLRELPSSILTRELHLEFLKFQDQDVKEKVPALNILVNQLPKANRALLEALSSFLLSVVNNAEVNRMNIRNGKPHAEHHKY
jgi:hypothetical protein